MLITQDTKLKDFKFWCGGKEKASLLTRQELNDLESHFDELYPNGIDDTTLNDYFWYDFGYLCELIGLKEDEVLSRKDWMLIG